MNTNISSNISYSYQNVDGEVKFSGEINGKKFTDANEFYKSMANLSVANLSAANNLVNQLSDTSTIDTNVDTSDSKNAMKDNTSIVIVECPNVKDELKQSDLISFCKKLNDAYRSIINDGISGGNVRVCKENLKIVEYSINDINTLIAKDIEESKIVRDYLKMSDELIDVLRNIPQYQDMQQKISKVIKERLGRIQSHISTNKRWKYLYERARNYFAYAGAVSNSLDDFTNVLQPFLAKATHQVVNDEPKNSEKAADVKQDNAAKQNNNDDKVNKDNVNKDNVNKDNFDKDILDIFNEKDILTNYLERLFKF